jgi:hypothetical protein
MLRGDHCLAPARTVDAPIDEAANRYSRLFPGLPPIEDDNAALLSLGVAGGVCDAARRGPTRSTPLRGGRCSASTSRTTSRPIEARSRRRPNS